LQPFDEPMIADRYEFRGGNQAVEAIP